MSNPPELSPHEQFIIDLKKFTAVTAVGVQALRRQGVGAIGHIQDYLDTVDLAHASLIEDQDEFVHWLDEVTYVLMEKGKVSWGAARKALNLFLRACFYNRYLSVEFRLDRLESWLEIPLDRAIADQIRKAGLGVVPPWEGLGELTKEKSSRFQDCASQMASKQKLSRGHLDVGLWVNNRKR